MATLYFRVATQNPASPPTTTYRLDIFDQGTPWEGWPCAPYGQPVTAGYVDLSKDVAGVGSHLAGACASNTTNGTNALRVSVSGNTVEAFVNGQTVLTYTEGGSVDPFHVTFRTSRLKRLGDGAGPVEIPAPVVDNPGARVRRGTGRTRPSGPVRAGSSRARGCHQARSPAFREWRTWRGSCS
jgi:hypothetical protein